MCMGHTCGVARRGELVKVFVVIIRYETSLPSLITVVNI